MDYLIGILGLAAMAAAYVGLGLADRGRSGCGGCALREDPENCGTCPVRPAGAPPGDAGTWPVEAGGWWEQEPGSSGIPAAWTEDGSARSEPWLGDGRRAGSERRRRERPGRE